jgi:coenzyme F420-0:L-glutamate ligase / coenzyme F420-1:gamma-L-glutamate ligase
MIALAGFPLVQAGDDLSALIAHACDRTGLALQAGDIVVVTSKIVSKSEGCTLLLHDVTPSENALHYAEITGKDPRIVEVVLRESSAVSRAAKGVLVVRHRLGFVSANAGIDQSNLENGDERVLLLPRDPDESARRIRDGLRDLLNVNVGIVISDSHGRPFRMGNVGVAIGVAGVPALRDLRGEHDLFGRELKITIQGYADMIAGASGLLTGEGSEGRPVIVLRGALFTSDQPVTAHALNRPAEQDLYR